MSHQLNENNKLSIGYGLHSRIEPLHIYLQILQISLHHKKIKILGGSKAHHVILAYDWNITEKLYLKIESYFQYLFDIPVIENSTISLLNLQNDWFIDDLYVNKKKVKITILI